MRRVGKIGLDKTAEVKISWLTEVGLLVKFRLTLTVVFSSVIAYVIAATGSVELIPLIMLGLGGFLVTAAANAFNQVLEREYDKQMERTAGRPLAAGRMQISEAVVLAGLMCLFGIVILGLFNPLTAFLGMISLIMYAFIYTPLKRYSTLAVAVGAIPGALPAMIGCVAFEGTISWLAIILFGIQFLWQFPHFWSIGWLSFDQYQRAGFKLVPMKNGLIDPNLGLNSSIYTMLLFPVIWTAFYLGLCSSLTAGIASLATIAFVAMAWRFHQNQSRKTAMQLMFGSIIYLPVVLVILMLGAL